MRIRIPINVLAVAGASAMMLGLGGGAAFAGDHPTPTPTVTVTPPPVPTPQTCTPRPVTFAPTAAPTDATLSAWHGGTPPPVINPQRRCRAESFNLSVTLTGDPSNPANIITNYARFRGPVSGLGSNDLLVSTNTSDRFSLPGPFQRVNLLHTGIPFPSVNLRTRTAAVIQIGLWQFAGGPVFSVFRNAIGNGTFRLVGLWHFPNIRGVCSLLFIRGNPLLQNRINPDLTVIGVRGDGLARR